MCQRHCCSWWTCDRCCKEHAALREGSRNDQGELMQLMSKSPTLIGYHHNSCGVQQFTARMSLLSRSQLSCLEPSVWLQGAAAVILDALWIHEVSSMTSSLAKGKFAHACQCPAGQHLLPALSCAPAIFCILAVFCMLCFELLNIA